ncbi:hypothetical protein H0X48_06315 [Candidatus Dependentiae bacterium]|nr:hypothetical protein [Candidatus Dependentiae bacterium]
MKNYIFLFASLCAAYPVYAGKNARAAFLRQMAAYEAMGKANGEIKHDVNCPRTGRGCPQCNLTEWREQGQSDKK